MRRYAPVLVASLVAALIAPLAFGQSRVPYIRTERAYPTGDRATSVLLLERTHPAEIRIGQEFQYELRLMNLTRGELEDVVLTEQFPPTFTVRSVTPPGANDRNTTVFQIGKLAPGAAAVIQVVGSTRSPQDLVWCAYVSTRTGACGTTRIVEPRLALQKFMPPEVVLCDEIPMRLVVSNPGSGVARGVRVIDQLPAGMLTADGRNAVQFDAGDIPAGQAREFTFVARAQRTGAFTNTARATEEGGISVDASATTTVRQCALQVAKSGPTLRFIGRPATFDITVRNVGDAPARDLVLTDNVPPGLTVVGADNNGQVAGGQVTWRIASLPPGAAATVRVSVNPTQIGRYTNSVVARAYCCEATGAAPIEIQGIPAILLEVIDVSDPIEVGANETYVIEVTNQGTATDTNIVIVATVPPEMELVSVEGPTAGAVSGKTITFAPLPTLAPKAKAVYKVITRGTRPADVRFKISMTSDQTRSPVEETESTHIYE